MSKEALETYQLVLKCRAGQIPEILDKLEALPTPEAMIVAVRIVIDLPPGRVRDQFLKQLIRRGQSADL